MNINVSRPHEVDINTVQAAALMPEGGASPNEDELSPGQVMRRYPAERTAERLAVLGSKLSSPRYRKEALHYMAAIHRQLSGSKPGAFDRSELLWAAACLDAADHLDPIDSLDRLERVLILLKVVCHDAYGKSWSQLNDGERRSLGDRCGASSCLRDLLRSGALLLLTIDSREPPFFPMDVFRCFLSGNLDRSLMPELVIHVIPALRTLQERWPQNGHVTELLDLAELKLSHL